MAPQLPLPPLELRLVVRAAKRNKALYHSAKALCGAGAAGEAEEGQMRPVVEEEGKLIRSKSSGDEDEVCSSDEPEDLCS